MGKFKVKVNSEAESREAQDLLEAIGYKKGACSLGNYPAIIVTTQDWATGDYCSTRALGLDIPAHDKYKEITLPGLRAMVNPMKEYLVPDNEGYRVAVQDARLPIAEDWIKIPEGAEILAETKNGLVFYKKHGDRFAYCFAGETEWGGTFTNPYDELGAFVTGFVWQRESEAKPLVDWSHVINNAQQIFDHENVGKPSLNDQYAEIEQVRRDLVNHPSHYTQGKVECIDALESATIGKSGIEAVCVANVIKYLWRYEEKNGLEDVKKAQWYLERLVASMGS